MTRDVARHERKARDMTTQEARERVQCVAALLDARMPGWAKKIDTGTLDVSTCDCVLSQLGDYVKVAEQIGVADTSEGAADCGFYVPGHETGDHQNPSWGLLTSAWIDEIAARLSQPVTWTHREPARRQAQSVPK